MKGKIDIVPGCSLMLSQSEMIFVFISGFDKIVFRRYWRVLDSEVNEQTNGTDVV